MNTGEGSMADLDRALDPPAKRAAGTRQQARRSANGDQPKPAAVPTRTAATLDDGEQPYVDEILQALADVLSRELGEESEAAVRLKLALVELAAGSLERAAITIEETVQASAATLATLAAGADRIDRLQAENQAMLDELVGAETYK